MAKVKNPKTLSGSFNIDRQKLDKLGVLDATLAIDTKLFIDPLVFPHSKHLEFSNLAVEQYRRHFETIIKFLAASHTPEDIARRTARKLLEFHEIKGTCLGYGAASIQGSGFGPELTERVLQVGKEIVDLGITDPDLFPAMSLFEAKIGPDRISDMATNVARGALIAFNDRILKDLALKGETFEIEGIEGRFLRNPFQETRTPIILVPKDILRKLPIANDWDEVADAASKNESIRKRVNEHIGHIWAAKSKRDKRELREEALTSKEAFQTLLDAIHIVPPEAYRVDVDPDGLVKWAYVANQFASGFPLNLLAFARLKHVDDVNEIVKHIIERFKQLIEHNGLNKELYKDNGDQRHEATAQRLFFAIAYCYCEANNLDVSPEVDSGNGQIDFKISQGFNARVLVEIKLSTNGKSVSGYKAQLETYKESEQTMRAFYVVIDVGRMGKKDERLIKIRNEALSKKEPLSELVFIDGLVKESASKRKV
jgi:hypothetical protein